MIGPLWLCFSQEVLHRFLIKPETCFCTSTPPRNRIEQKKQKKQDQCAKSERPGGVKVTIRKGRATIQKIITPYGSCSHRGKSCSAREHRFDKHVHG